MDLIFFLIGTLILLFSGDMLVRAAIDISLKISVSPMIVGLTVIAFGTSAPELLVGVQATWNGFAGLALGNIIGSNITNILLIVGMPAVIIAVRSDDPGLSQNYYIMLLATFVFIGFLLFGPIQVWQGIFLIFFLILFVLQAIFYSYKSDENRTVPELTSERKVLSSSVLTGFVFAGFIGLPFGAHIVITSATSLANAVGVSEEVIGLTVVAIGTSLPELATSIAAAFRKQVSLLLGNVIGSNMFNILGIAGIAALIAPLQLMDKTEIMSLSTLLFSSAILAPFIMFKKSINRQMGIIFLLFYLVYILLLF